MSQIFASRFIRDIDKVGEGSKLVLETCGRNLMKLRRILIPDSVSLLTIDLFSFSVFVIQSWWVLCFWAFVSFF